MTFSGTWAIVSSPDFYDDYLSEEVDPYVKLRQSGKNVQGEYHVGYQQGTIDGRLDAGQRVTFSFEGSDEMDSVSGAGTIVLQGDRMVFTLMYHYGDDYTFECERRASN
jgi:hypothetical protein